MSRYQLRTRTLSLDVVNRVMGLFGTIKNAHRQLGLEGIVTYNVTYRALNHYTIKPTDLERIEDAWDRWCELFLRPEVPVTDHLAVTPANMDIDPVWLLQHPAKKAI